MISFFFGIYLLMSCFLFFTKTQEVNKLKTNGFNEAEAWLVYSVAVFFAAGVIMVFPTIFVISVYLILLSVGILS